ncbi:MAG: MBL fold metallo-hydrolase [Lachnospiraceae bacterium]|nr:MBL fold metallo-hydrolase [Lachnospiraceae bacterium]
MQLTYIHHSGFLLETPACTLLFDFVEGTLPQIPAGKPLYVFVSHTHHDHYTKKIFSVAETAAAQGATEICYVVSDDVPRRDVPAALKEKTVFLKPHQKWEDGRIHVETLVSNDTGVAFVLAVPAEAAAPAAGNGAATHEPSLQIYFAGDLNAWNWDGDEEDMALIKIYHEELAHINDRIFDLAFIPLDPRLGEEYIQGITDFFDTCGCEAKVIAPMHMWGQYETAKKARALTDKYPYMDRVLPVSREGERFTL